MKELTGVVINPSKSKKRKRRKPSTRKVETRKSRRVAGNNVILITNPAKDKQALLELATGTAVGLAGGKLLDSHVFSKVNLPQLPAGISLGDAVMLGTGLFLIKKGGKGKEFATGMVAGAGAKLVLNLLDSLVFKGNNVVSLHGEEPYEIEQPYELGNQEEFIPEQTYEPYTL